MNDVWLGDNPDMAATDDRVSVVIACHTQERLEFLVAAIESVSAQEPQPACVVVSVDHEPELARIVSARFPDVIVVENVHAKGASGTRNTGAAQTTTPLVAFLDDDARARPAWLSALVEPFDDPDVVCTGGHVVPAWSGSEPGWFPDEFAWVVGASHRGLPTTRARVRNVWSENMAVRSEAFSQVGGFRLDFGKVGAVSRPEDTDLCIRLGKSAPGASVVYVPDAVVDHHVGAERARFGFFVKRCYFEGRGKIELARHNEGNDDLGDEREYLLRTIPQGLVRYMRTGVSNRDADQIKRAGAVLGGLAAAASGAAVSLARRQPA
ncbi:MAG: glycosyltransferase [Acidimicrobiales bacterium]|jgi:GT2 family glycosyltransferase